MESNAAAFQQVIAAWVQAIGSIFAIVGAFGVAWYQNRAQIAIRKKERQEEALDTAHAVVAVCIDVVRAIRDSAESMRMHAPGNAFKAETDRLDEALYSMRTLLGRPIPPEMMLPLLQVQRLTTFSHRAMRQRAGSTKGFAADTVSKAEARHRLATRELNKLASIRNALKEVA